MHPLLYIIAAVATSAPQESARPVNFVDDVQPILREHCLSCHRGSFPARLAQAHVEVDSKLRERGPDVFHRSMHGLDAPVGHACEQAWVQHCQAVKLPTRCSRLQACVVVHTEVPNAVENDERYAVCWARRRFGEKEWAFLAHDYLACRLREAAASERVR